MNLNLYILDSEKTILNAIQQIEENKKGFLVIVDKNNYVLGTLTDGDIRRCILRSQRLDESVKNVLTKDYVFIYENESFNRIIEIFKSPKIKFLPIIDKEGRLVNIITKEQFHTVLLEGIKWDLKFDFFSLDSQRTDLEIYNRPWGYYKTVFLSEYSRVKIIQVNPGEELSLQEHKKREEHWVIVKGEGKFIIGESVRNVTSGTYIFIPKGCKHKITNTSKEIPLMISEVQLGTYFGEDDIIRYEDKYNRI